LLAGAAVILLVQADWNGSSTSSNIHGSGVAATQTRDLSPFTALDLAGANSVRVEVGGTQSVVVRADDNLIERVTTEVRDGKLVIANSGNFTTSSPMSVDVTVPGLAAVSMTGSGTVTVAGVEADRFTVLVPGSGVLRVSGTADVLDARLTGSGDVQLGDLAANDVTAKVAGSGQLHVHATRSLEASVSGVGAIFYTGNPGKVSENVTGVGVIAEQ
jgi:hypothetical protein